MSHAPPIERQMLEAAITRASILRTTLQLLLWGASDPNQSLLLPEDIERAKRVLAETDGPLVKVGGV